VIKFINKKNVWWILDDVRETESYQMKQNIMKGVKWWSPCSHGCKCFPKQYLIRDHPPTERSFYTHLFFLIAYLIVFFFFLLYKTRRKKSLDGALIAWVVTWIKFTVSASIVFILEPRQRSAFSVYFIITLRYAHYKSINIFNMPPKFWISLGYAL
jgi:hypothetical protein